MQNFDLAIIGGGPAGYTAAERAAHGGLTVVLFEKDNLGGVCLNKGCIPTKSLLYAAKLVDLAKGAVKYGVTCNEVNYDVAKVVARKNKVVRKLVAGVKARMNAAEVTVVMNVAAIAKETEEGILLSCAEELYMAKHVLLCCGSETIIPSIKGLKKEDYWSSDEALSPTVIPPLLYIIGGGVIGLEFASFYHSMGSKVTVIEMASEILGGKPDKLSALLREDYSKRGVTFCLESKVCARDDDGSLILERGNGELISLPPAQLLLCVGRKANLSVEGIAMLHLETERGGVVVNSYMQSSNPRVYACGDITGHSMLAHTAVREAEVAVNHLLGKIEEMNYRAIPQVVYTSPELASVGITYWNEEDLNRGCKIAELPMGYAGRFVAENEGVNGLCRLFANENGVIVGAQILGNGAAEIITTATVAITHQLSVSQWKEVVFPHPTVSEILRETVFNLESL